jgi:LacI family transcriptional regulator, galactose operon repressor
VAGRSSSRRPLQKDVAELAGVSRTTVSFVLNGVENIAIPDETRQRVLNAAAELGFRPNAMARGLRGGRSNVLGLVTSDIVTTPYAVQIVKGAQDAALARGLTLLILDDGGSQTAGGDTVDRLLEWSVDGLIFATEYHRPYRLPVGAKHLPTVLVNCFAEPDAGSAVPTIIPDEVQGGLAATQVLIDAGHRRIAFINGPAEFSASSGRLAGYRQALRRARIRFDPRLVREGDWWQESAANHTSDLLTLPQPPTAIFCANDWMAMGAYDAIREVGLRIPDDIAVIGFDNRVEIADHMRPRLTTIALPYSEMGSRAVEVLMNPQLLAAAATELISCPLIRRSSV